VSGRTPGNPAPGNPAPGNPTPANPAPGPAAGELPLPLLHRGKVRDVYAVDGDHLLLVASDRVSAYDVVLDAPVPDKGAVLTGLSLWWFDQLADLVPHHVVTASVADYPAALRPHAAALAGRSMLCRRLRMLPVECVARAYLAGSGWESYAGTGSVFGRPAPPGLVEGSRLPAPLFTPTTKGAPGEHDEPMSEQEVRAAVGPELAEQLEQVTVAVLARGDAIARQRGILVADTKIELGLDPDGVLRVGDEVLTPDSSRFWPADRWRPGGSQPSFDKQPLRDWLSASGWDRRPPPPALPEEVVMATRTRYVEAYERLTGESFASYLVRSSGG